MKLKHLATVKARIGWHGLSTDDYGSGDRLLVTGTEISVGRVQWDLCQGVSDEIWARDPWIQLSEGDVLVTKDGTIGKVALVPEVHAKATLNSGVFRVTPVPSILDSRFLFWVLESKLFRHFVGLLGAGSTISHLYQRDFIDFEVPAPSLVAQRAIADYLDTETARIDALIEKKQRMIKLLDQRLSMYIRSRVSSLDCPVLPLKRAWQVVDCKHRTPDYLEEGYPVVSPGEATPGRLELSRAHRFVSEADYQDLASPPRRPSRGDIIYSRNASIGIASYVDTDEPFCMGQDVCLITSTDQNQLYLAYVLNTLGVDQLEEQKIGSTFSRVNITQIVELAIPTPNVAAQAEIAHELDEKSEKHAVVAKKLTHQVALLQERRQALITAAVTGEFEIKGAAA